MSANWKANFLNPNAVLSANKDDDIDIDHEKWVPDDIVDECMKCGVEFGKDKPPSSFALTGYSCSNFFLY